MLNRNCLNFGLFLVMFFCLTLQAKEPVKIIQILDTNLFKTADGKIISLANLQTISIENPDSLKRNFALKVYRYAEKSLINKVLFVEVATKNDSVVVVHLWDELMESVNRKFLHEGYGYFTPEPKSKYLKKYENAYRNAKEIEVGIYNIKLLRSKGPIKPNAFWLTFDFGVGRAYHNDHSIKSVCYSRNTSIQLRKSLLVCSLGFQGTAPYEEASIHTYYCTIGRSFYDRRGEAIILIGANINQYRYYTCGEPGLKKSKHYFGVILRTQFLVHLPKLIGFGIGFNANINTKISYVMFSVNINIGEWNF
jgi:hypothetical protein